jgi:hypothetical protein
MATRSTTASTPVIELAGAVVGPLRTVQLPGFEISQGVVPAGPGGAPRLARDATVTEMQAEFDLSQSDALSDWLLALARGKPAAPMSGAVVVLDANSTVKRRAEFADGLLTAIELPLLDATARTAVSARLSWLPARMAYAKLSDANLKLALPTKRKKAPLASNFRVKGLPFDAAARVTRVQLPQVSAQLDGLSSGGTPGYARIDLGEVELIFSGAAARDAALDWALKLMGDGRVTDSEFLNLDIELLDPALKNVLMTFKLGGCALRGYAESPIEGGADALPTASLRLAVGQLDLVFAAV